MNWLLLTLLAVTARSFQSITTKMLSTRVQVSPMTQAALFTGMAAVLSVVISPFFGGISLNGLAAAWGFAVVMILAQALGNVLFFKGLAELEASVTAVAFSSILLWGAILSVLFLDSSFSLKQVAGIALLLVAILIVQYKKGIKRIETPVLYIVGSALLFAVFQVMSAELAKEVTTATYLVLNFGGSTLLVWLVYKKRIMRDLQQLKSKKLHVTQSVTLASLCSMGYFIFSYLAYREAPDRGVVVVLLTAQVVLSVILGIIFLRESSHISRKLGAGLLAVIAGVLIKS